MKKLLLVLFSFICIYANSQSYTFIGNYGYQHRRVAVDSTLHIPTGCGTPSLKNSAKLKQAAIYYDTCNARLYVYDSKPKTWSYIKSDVNFWDTTTTGIYPNVDKMVGINKTNPSRRLDINGTFSDSTAYGRIFNGDFNSAGVSGTQGNYVTVQASRSTLGNYRASDQNVSLSVDTLQRLFYAIWNGWHITEQTKYNDGTPCFQYGFKKTSLADYYRDFVIDTTGFYMKALSDTNYSNYQIIQLNGEGIKLQAQSDGLNMSSAIELNTGGVYIRNPRFFWDSTMTLLGSQFDSLQANHLLIKGAKYYLADRFELGIVLTALDDSAVDVKAKRKQYVPMYYEKDIYDDFGHVWRGVYHDSMLVDFSYTIPPDNDTLQANEYVVYGGRAWKSKHGNLMTPIDDYTLDTAFILVHPDTGILDGFYQTKWFDVVYDDLHKTIIRQSDDKGNVLGYSYDANSDVGVDSNGLTRSDWGYVIFFNNSAGRIINNRTVNIHSNIINSGQINSNFAITAITLNNVVAGIQNNVCNLIDRNNCNYIDNNSVRQIANNSLLKEDEISDNKDRGLEIENNDYVTMYSLSQTFSTPDTSYVITHARSLPGSSYVVLTPKNSVAASHSFYVTNVTDTTFTLNVVTTFNETAEFYYIIK